MSSSLRILAVIAAPVLDLHSGQPTVQLNPRQEWRNIVTGCEGKSTTVRVERLPVATEKHLNDTLAQAALAYIWALDERMVPIPGFKTVQQVEENSGAIQLGPLSEDQMGQIAEILDKYNSPD